MMPIREIPLRDVKITDAFWAPRQALMTDVTIPYMEKILRAEESHAVRNFRIAAGEETGISAAWFSRTATWPNGWKRLPIPCS